MVTKLTESNINPEKLNKMKVKHAAQVFSRTVSTSMGGFSGKFNILFYSYLTNPHAIFISHCIAKHACCRQTVV